MQGRLLGPGAATLKGMVEQSGCGMEVHDSHGLLKGRHPNPLDPELHVFCFADSQVRDLLGSKGRLHACWLGGLRAAQPWAVKAQAHQACLMFGGQLFISFL